MKNYKLCFQETHNACLPYLRTFLQRWLPDGQIVGNEYVAKNPTRNDQRKGSFKVNLNTGKWADFATGDAGSTIVSLAAYLSGQSHYEAAKSLLSAISEEESYYV